MSLQRWIRSARRHLRATLRVGVVADERLRELQIAVADLGLHLAAGEREDLRGLAAQSSGEVGQIPASRRLTSELCKSQSFREPYFAAWSRRLNQPLRYNRKLWEFAFICQALHERGLLSPGRRGLGFGVGEEPLSSLFAKLGCDIVGTDMESEEAVRAGWATTGQHASGAQQMHHAAICDAETFRRHVTYRTVDMNRIPEDLRGFDFCWSACCFEHLGSLEAGLAFVENSIATLKPGGVAVHTTEFNLASNDATLTDGAVVLYRRRDIEGLRERLAARGFLLERLDFTVGDGAVDRYLDIPPFRDEPHLKLAIAGFATTSIGLIVSRPP